MDAVEAANSGIRACRWAWRTPRRPVHPHLKFDPADPNWPDRDRFVLSAGHGSMLIYALLHLTGYERPTMDDIRASGSSAQPVRRPPENFELPGVETTTGPLGQGLAMAVGMAIAERHLNAVYGDDLVDHRTYRDRRRRLPDGRHQPRGGRACRPPEARPADRAVGRQQDHHRRLDRPVAQRGRDGAPCGERLAHGRVRRLDAARSRRRSRRRSPTRGRA
jgi:hypothetical protein